jgi:hypothetical protein
MKDTANHPVGTTYDVLVPGRAARCRGVPLRWALASLARMRAMTKDCILVGHLPNGERVVGCTGSWEELDGSVTLS